MIRPYLTVINDSFHEASASRVLWILLVVLTLLLAGLAPLGLQHQRASQLFLEGVNDWPGLVAKIKREADAKAPSPGKRIWQLSDDAFKKKIDDVLAGDDPTDISREAASALLDELNDLLRRRDFYDAAAWSGVKLDAELTGQVKRGLERLSEDDLVWVNRQLFKAAFPAEVARMPAEELHVSYFGAAIGSPIPVSRATAEPFISEVVGGIMSFFVGTVAVFIAILVTSPIIPHMFDAGAIDLLLSKPVVRWLLFLAKFAGGCAFILLCGGYFIVGLWLIMGLRFGLWNHSILLCIPLFLFLFSVYYSVSALAAVRWKNAIVSVVITILFWFSCFVVGMAKNVVETIFLKPDCIVNLVSAGESLVAVNRSGQLLEWRSDKWERIVKSNSPGPPRFAMQPVLAGPVFDARRKQLLYVQQPLGAHFSFVPPRPTLIQIAWVAGAWRQKTGPPPPRGTTWLFLSPDGRPVVLGPLGVFALDEQASPAVAKGTVTPPRNQAAGPGAKTPRGPGAANRDLPVVSKIFGLFSSRQTEAYVPLGPKPALTLANPFSAAMDAASGKLVVYRAGKLSCLVRRADGKYRRGPEREFCESTGPASVAIAGGTVVVARRDGEVLLLDAATLRTRKRFRPAGSGEPYMVQGAKDSRRFALLMHSGKLVVFDANGDNCATVDRDASAIGLDAEGRLLVADRGTRVSSYDFESLHAAQRWQPRLDVLQTAYRYVILPLYTVFPKPGELDNVVHYLLTGQETVAQGPPMEADLRQARINIDVYGPIASSLAFVVVMLAITCGYVQRMDF